MGYLGKAVKNQIISDGVTRHTRHFEDKFRLLDERLASLNQSWEAASMSMDILKNVLFDANRQVDKRLSNIEDRLAHVEGRILGNKKVVSHHGGPTMSENFRVKPKKKKLPDLIRSPTI